ncbi:hypothetical protein [Ramlibacter albus]|uniref:Tetratricopeptide repeat protein n=1 Tax=Ramlibacter albus TaxID=2079448 RepID=A0A923MEI9_9BURK|nr:hypothetical protein [Ramlibacter albus]MBC5767552.1 hypothetical protein [Ramlibacter albus]
MRHAILGACLCLVAQWCAAAQGTSLEDAARDALAQKKYAQVIALYEPSIVAGDALGDLAHYRRAIAFNQLSRPLEAWQALSKAIAANPAGTFASSRARLDDLKASILARCAEAGHDGCEVAIERGAGPAPTQPTSGEPPAAAAVRLADAAPQTASVESKPVLEGGLPATPQPRAAPTAAIEVSKAGDSTNGVLLLLVGITLAVASWQAWMTHRRDRRFPAGQHGLERLRDDVGAMLLHLAAAGHDSSLRSRLQELLPLLEQEAGRSAYRSTGDGKVLIPADQKATAMAQHLARNPPDALSSPPGDIEALFRRPAR